MLSEAQVFVEAVIAVALAAMIGATSVTRGPPRRDLSDTRRGRLSEPLVRSGVIAHPVG
jgi:hypothetical protein